MASVRAVDPFGPQRHLRPRGGDGPTPDPGELADRLEAADAAFADPAPVAAAGLAAPGEAPEAPPALTAPTAGALTAWVTASEAAAVLGVDPAEVRRPRFAVKLGGAELAPVSPCQPWCAIPDASESGVDLAHLAQTHPAWCCPKIDLEDADHLAKARWAAGAASSLLFRMSGLRFNGGCTSEEYLCLRSVDGCWALGWGDDWRSYPAPTGDGETWVNHRCGRSACDCGRRIRLPFAPVVEVESLTIGDALVPEANYQLAGDSLYLGADAPDADVCFDALTGAGLLVTWTWGQAPPPEGVMAACVFTCELFKACTGQECAIPKRTRTVTRPGISYEALNPQEFLDKGRTGITEVDYFLNAWGTDIPTTVTFPEDVAPIDFGSRGRARW